MASTVAASPPTSLLSSIFGENKPDNDPKLEEENVDGEKKKRKPRHKKSKAKKGPTGDDDDDDTAALRSQIFSDKTVKALPPRPQRVIPAPFSKPDDEKDQAESNKDGDEDAAAVSKKKRRRKKNTSNDDQEKEEQDETKEVSEKDSKKTKLDGDGGDKEAVVSSADGKDISKGGDENGEDQDGKDDDQEERTVFVGNLPLSSTTRKSLAQIFQNIDGIEIQSTRLRGVPVTGVKLPTNRAGDDNLVKKVCAYNSKLIDYESPARTIHGYVVLKDASMVELAIEKCNNMEVPDSNAPTGVRRLRVDRASPTVDPSRSVFCGNLPYATDEVSLHNHFVKGCGLDNVNDILGVRVVRDKATHQCKGFGYVLFREKSMVSIALKRMHQSTYKNKELRVHVCGKRFKGRQGKPKERHRLNDTQDNPKPKSSDLTSSAAKSPKSDKKSAPSTSDTPNDQHFSVGAFRRILAKQSGQTPVQKRKRGDSKKDEVKKKKSGLSKRAELERKTEKRVKKLQKRISKGMGKNRR